MTDKEIEIVTEEKLIVDQSLKTASTYSFHGEDHTLGNLLRNLLVKE